MKDDRKYLLFIVECIRRIEEDVTGGKQAYLSSHMVQDAVLRNLQVLAESTQRLSDSLKASQPEIKWPEIAGFRNFLVHDYLGVDLEVVWHIVEEDVPSLKKAVAGLIEGSS